MVAYKRVSWVGSQSSVCIAPAHCTACTHELTRQQVACYTFVCMISCLSSSASNKDDGTKSDTIEKKPPSSVTSDAPSSAANTDEGGEG